MKTGGSVPDSISSVLIYHTITEIHNIIHFTFSITESQKCKTTGGSNTGSTGSVFNYDALFVSQIEAKKRDHTYRVFKKVSRKGADFPIAHDITTGKDITVWCSNDYLGMSWHPDVQGAVV